MRKSLVVVVTLIAALALVGVALAKSVSDPNEAAVADRDIRTAKLAKPSSSTYVWTMVTWDTFASDELTPTGMSLYLDTKGGTGNDYVVELSWDLFTDELICQVEKPSGSFVKAGTASRPNQTTAECRFTKSGLTIDKRIRWRTTSASIGATDKAPNTGYVTGV